MIFPPLSTRQVFQILQIDFSRGLRKRTLGKQAAGLIFHRMVPIAIQDGPLMQKKADPEKRMEMMVCILTVIGMRFRVMVHTATVEIICRHNMASL